MALCRRIVVLHDRDVIVVALIGEHDLATRTELRAVIDAACSHGLRVVIDLSRTTFIDSSIASAILSAFDHRASPEQEYAIVAAAGGAADRTLRLLGIDRKIPIYPAADDGPGKHATGHAPGGQATADDHTPIVRTVASAHTTRITVQARRDGDDRMPGVPSPLDPAS